MPKRILVGRLPHALVATGVWIAVFGLLCESRPEPSRPTNMQMVQRIERVKPSVVRVLVDGMPAGTGFVIDADGLIATCFHVIEEAIERDTTNSPFVRHGRIQVELHGGRKLVAFLASPSISGVEDAALNDHAILKVISPDLVPLKLGSFSDVSEGSLVYILGFPLSIDQPIFAVGFLSTKWQVMLHKTSRRATDVAWLDITMNAGNSGGPVLLLSDSPADDTVIGLANFNLNPFARPAVEVRKTIQKAQGIEQQLMGVDFKEFVKLVSAALENNSLGVGGCVSVDYLREAVEK